MSGMRVRGGKPGQENRFVFPEEERYKKYRDEERERVGPFKVRFYF
jgi:hypothetical protein